MKKLLLTFVSGIYVVALLAQTNPANTLSNDPYEVQNRAYKAALKNYDLPSATVALYNMIALKPERTDLQDSLALVYFGSERYAQSYLVGEEILKNNPQRNDMLELVAVSKQNLGLIKEALADYEKLYSQQKALFYLYQMATLQYQLKRYGECVASLDQIIGDAKADKEKVSIRNQGGNQEVPMKAAALNVKGICAVELNQIDAAKENFKKAIELYPDFALAKGNLDNLNNKSSDKSAAKPATTTSPKATTTGVKK